MPKFVRRLSSQEMQALLVALELKGFIFPATEREKLS